MKVATVEGAVVVASPGRHPINADPSAPRLAVSWAVASSGLCGNDETEVVVPVESPVVVSVAGVLS